MFSLHFCYSIQKKNKKDETDDSGYNGDIEDEDWFSRGIETEGVKVHVHVVDIDFFILIFVLKSTDLDDGN